MKARELLLLKVRLYEKQVREIAKQNGVRVRRHHWSGIDAYFPDGTKEHYHGWTHIRNDFERRFTA